MNFDQCNSDVVVYIRLVYDDILLLEDVSNLSHVKEFKVWNLLCAAFKISIFFIYRVGVNEIARGSIITERACFAQALGEGDRTNTIFVRACASIVRILIAQLQRHLLDINVNASVSRQLLILFWTTECNTRRSLMNTVLTIENTRVTFKNINF